MLRHESTLPPDVLTWLLLGVQICADTVIGSQLTRGISGGQKKRVTTGARLPAHGIFAARHGTTCAARMQGSCHIGHAGTAMPYLAS